MTLAATKRRTTLSAQVTEQIRDLISTGSWAVGSRIPPESELTQKLQVSRNTVREALRSLVHSGLLEARVGDGTYVRAASELQVALNRAARAARFSEVFEVRALLERRSAGLAAMNATTEQVQVMRNVLAERDQATTYVSFLTSDLAFHRLVVKASGNALLTEIYLSLDEINTHLNAFAEASASFEDFLREHHALNASHHKLLDEIEAGHDEFADAIAEEIVRLGAHLIDSIVIADHGR